jgi:hypothetical protein
MEKCEQPPLVSQRCPVLLDCGKNSSILHFSGFLFCNFGVMLLPQMIIPFTCMVISLSRKSCELLNSSGQLLPFKIFKFAF